MARNTLRLYITADGTVATRAFREVGEASDRTARQVQHDARKQEESFRVIEGGANHLKGAVGGLTGTVGLGGLAFGIADVVKQGEQWQLQQAQLATALKGTGQYSVATMTSIRRTAEEMSTHGGFSGPEEIRAITQFVRLTRSASEALRLNHAATELARGANLGYGQAQRIIGQLLTGNVGRLQRYVGILQPVKSAEFALSQAHGINTFQMEQQSKSLGKLGPLWLRQQELLHHLTPQQLQHAQLLDRQRTATEALARIQAKYGNDTQTFSHTAAGAISNLRNRYDLLGETIGRDVLPYITAIVTFLSRHTKAVFEVIGALAVLAVGYKTATALIGLWRAAVVISEGVVAGLTFGVGALRTAVFILGAAFIEMGADATLAWGAATLGISLLIAAVIAAGVYIVTHWKQVTQWFGNAAHNVGHAFVVAFDWVKKTVGGVFDWIWAKISWVANHIKSLVGGILHLPGHIWHGITHGLSSITGGLLHSGGVVRPHYMAGGGPVGIDTVPLWAAPGEFVVRREAVQSIGANALNAINATGEVQGQASGSSEAWITMPVTIQLPGGRILAEETVHTSAKRAAASGAMYAGA